MGTESPEKKSPRKLFIKNEGEWVEIGAVTFDGKVLVEAEESVANAIKAAFSYFGLKPTENLESVEEPVKTTNLEIHKIESRPVQAEAVQYLGSDQNGKDIVNWVLDSELGDAGWSTSYTIRRGDGISKPQVSQRLSIYTRNTENYTEVQPNNWIVLIDGEFQVLTTEELNETYKEKN